MEIVFLFAFTIMSLWSFLFKVKSNIINNPLAIFILAPCIMEFIYFSLTNLCTFINLEKFKIYIKNT